MQSSELIKSFNITKTTNKQPSFKVESIVGMFDIKNFNLEQTFTGQILLPETWNIGLIVGKSGTGKSTIAKELFGVYKTAYTDKPIIDEMPKDKTVEEITKTFNNVGFSSPPNWIKPYSVLSNGEKMRVDLAKSLLEISGDNIIVFDEFTSVVDRDVAKIVSFVTQKAVRKSGGKFIAVTCHYDVADWLDPDWIFNTDTMQMVERKKKLHTSLSISMKEITHIGNILGTTTI
jgi:ABC-type lipoprotein export system ATPase subunit